MIIFCDLDSTITDMHTPWLTAYNAEYDDALTVEHLTSWNIEKYVKCGKNIYDIIARPGFFRDVRAFPGAVDGVRALSNDHEVYIVTDTFYPINAKEKMEWCAEHLPFLPRQRVILGAAKALLRGNVLIDDAPHNIVAYRSAWPNSFICTLAFPYNEHVADVADVYARDWRTPEAAWAEIVAAVLTR